MTNYVFLAVTQSNVFVYKKRNIVRLPTNYVSMVLTQFVGKQTMFFSQNSNWKLKLKLRCIDHMVLHLLCTDFFVTDDHNTGRIQFKVLPSCLAKSSDFGSALLKYYVNVQVFNGLLK